MADAELVKLTKEYITGHKKELAVSNVDLKIGDGEFLTLLGPSGCGKSTTLRCIAGLVMPTSGRIFVGGEDITDIPPQKRDLAMVFQEIALYPYMKVRDNLTYPFKVRGIPKRERKQKAEEIGEILRLSDFLDKYPGELSGGQRQRVALGRAIIRRPRLFLMDEPMSNLDAKLKIVMRKEIKEIIALIKTTVIYVTHDQEEAMAMSDRIAVMNEGRIVQIDKPFMVYDYPINTFVGSFVGMPAMNLVSAKVEETSADLLSIKFDGVEKTCSIRIRECDYNGCGHKKCKKGGIPKDILIGFRPESVRIVSEMQKDFPGTLKIKENIGNKNILYVDTPMGEIRVCIDRTEEVSLVGKLGLSIQKHGINLFDQDRECVGKGQKEGN